MPEPTGAPPRRPGSDHVLLLDNNDIFQPARGQMVSDAHPDNSTPDNYDFRCIFHNVSHTRGGSATDLPTHILSIEIPATLSMGKENRQVDSTQRRRDAEDFFRGHLFVSSSHSRMYGYNTFHTIFFSAPRRRVNLSVRDTPQVKPPYCGPPFLNEFHSSIVGFRRIRIPSRCSAARPFTSCSAPSRNLSNI